MKFCFAYIIISALIALPHTATAQTTDMEPIASTTIITAEIDTLQPDATATDSLLNPDARGAQTNIV